VELVSPPKGGEVAFDRRDFCELTASSNRRKRTGKEEGAGEQPQEKSLARPESGDNRRKGRGLRDVRPSKGRKRGRDRPQQQQRGRRNLSNVGTKSRRRKATKKLAKQSSILST